MYSRSSTLLICASAASMSASVLSSKASSVSSNAARSLAIGRRELDKQPLARGERRRQLKEAPRACDGVWAVANPPCKRLAAIVGGVWVRRRLPLALERREVEDDHRDGVQSIVKDVIGVLLARLIARAALWMVGIVAVRRRAGFGRRRTCRSTQNGIGSPSASDTLDLALDGKSMSPSVVPVP